MYIMDSIVKLETVIADGLADIAKYKLKVDFQKLKVTEAQLKVTEAESHLHRSVQVMNEKIARVDKAKSELHRMQAIPTLYEMFRKERVRLPVTQEEIDECKANPATSNRIKLTFTFWKKDRRSDLVAQAKLKLEDLHKQILDGLAEEFGAPVNGGWPMIKVFTSSDAVAYWDEEHASQNL